MGEEVSFSVETYLFPLVLVSSFLVEISSPLEISSASLSLSVFILLAKMEDNSFENPKDPVEFSLSFNRNHW